MPSVSNRGPLAKWLLDPEAAIELSISVYVPLNPLLTLHASLVCLPCNARLLGATATNALREAFDRPGIQASLAKILSRHVDLGLLPGTADRDVGVLAVSLPAAGEDARGLGGDPLRLVDVDGVAE